MGSVSSRTETNCLPVYCESMNSIYADCICLQHFANMYAVLFRGEGHESIPDVQLQEATPLPTMDTFTAPPIPLAYNDPIFSTRMTRGAHSSEDEIAPLREKECEVCYTNYDLKGTNYNKLKEYSKEGEYYFGSSEDEDVCPTCLEEYSEDNPKIVMQCSHDFHLGCIYEWMERSELCPVCGKKMMFEESSS